MKKTLQIICALFIVSGCSIEEAHKKNEVAELPHVRQKLQTSEIQLLLNSKQEDFTSTGTNLFLDEVIRLQIPFFYWERRDRGTPVLVDQGNWSGCNSLRMDCWNKHSETYTMEFQPPIMQELTKPLLKFPQLPESIQLLFKLKSGSEVLCKASDLVHEKTETQIILKIQNSNTCKIFQTPQDEVLDLQVANRFSLGEQFYYAGVFIRHDDGNRGGYTKLSYVPTVEIPIALTFGLR